MSMHLCGPALTTTGNSRKKKTADVDSAKLAADLKEYNKLMRRYGSPELTMEQYIKYRRGKVKVSTKGKPLKYELPKSNHRTQYPSGKGIDVTSPKKPEQHYTGTLIKGLGTMHKSNSVPILDQTQAIEIARMRRG